MFIYVLYLLEDFFSPVQQFFSVAFVSKCISTAALFRLDQFCSMVNNLVMLIFLEFGCFFPLICDRGKI